MKNQQPYQTYRIVEVRHENKSTNSLILDNSLPKAQPGQFVMVWLPGVGEKPYSIMDNDPFMITVTSVGEFSESLYNLKTTDHIWVRGPFGHGFKLNGKQHVLAGGGYGAAPLYFLAKQACRQNYSLSVCLGARSADDLMLVKAFTSLGCRVLITTDDGSLGEKGLVTQAVESVLLTNLPQTIYACGPISMLSALSVLGRKWRIPSQLSWEAKMRCGIGLCGSCELDEDVRLLAGIPVGWMACKDGPVFISNNN